MASTTPAERGSADPTPPFTPARRVLVVADLTHYTRVARALEDLETARFVDAYYRLCHEAFAPAGGRIVKFMGDACLAVFPPERCADAIEAVQGLSARVEALPGQWGLDVPVRLGANVHLATVIEGSFGPPECAQRDILGAGVNFTFLLGRGEGIRLSEPAYRKLPSDRRGPWEKIKTPARYVLG